MNEIQDIKPKQIRETTTTELFENDIDKNDS